jgi:hypothetical protein
LIWYDSPTGDPRALDKQHGHLVGVFYFKKESQKMKAFLVIVVSIIGLWSLVLYLGRNDLQAPTPTYAAAAPVRSAPQTHKVVYQILTTTCINFDVTYEMPGGTSQKSVRACPDKGVIDSRTATHGNFLYLSAQNTTKTYAEQSFSCSISVDGEEVASVQSAGFASIASCDARID